MTNFAPTAPLFPNGLPDGTSVKASPESGWRPDQLPPSGAPLGSVADTRTASGGTVTFQGLTSGVTYFAYALINGVHTYTKFTVGADTPGGTVQPGPNTVGSSEITDDSIAAADIGASAVGTSEVNDNTLTASDLAADSVDASEIAADAVRASEIQASAVGTSEVADGTVADADLASPNNGVYRKLLITSGRFTTAAVAATKYFALPSSNDISSLGGNGAAFNIGAWLLQLTAADLAVAGKTTKLRLNGHVNCTGAPGINVVINLYSLTQGATHSLNAAVSGSTITFNTPAANSITTGNSGDFDLPANGLYAVGFTVSGTPTGIGNVNVAIEVRNV